MEPTNLTASEPLTAIISIAIILLVAMLTAIAFMGMVFAKGIRKEEDVEIEDASEEYDITPYAETDEDNVIF